LPKTPACTRPLQPFRREKGGEAKEWRGEKMGKRESKRNGKRELITTGKGK